MSSSREKSTAKDQVNIKIDQKTAVGRESPQFPPEHQSKRRAVQPRQLLGTIESSNLEKAKLNVVASHMLEDFDSEYEIYTLRNDATFLAKESDLENVSKANHLEVHNVVTQECDNCTFIQSPKIASATVTSSDKPSELTRTGEMPAKVTLFVESSIKSLGQNRIKHSMKRKIDPADEETASVVCDISPRRTCSLGLGSSVQLKAESEYLQADKCPVRKRMHDRPSPAYKVDAMITNAKDDEANHCCLDVQSLSNTEYAESRLERGHCCGNTFVPTDRVDSELHVSCISKVNNSAQVAILCGSCSHPFTNYAKVAYETIVKSYLTTLYRGGNQSILIPMILIEYHNLNSLVKEKLFTSIPFASVASDESATKNFLNDGVWKKEDGCVYEHIFCPHCEDQSICVGVHVAACDKKNLQLMDKVSLPTSLV